VAKKHKPIKPREAAKSRTPVIVTVSGRMLKNIHQLAEQLGAKGMKVNRVMPVLGVISGTLPSSKMSTLRTVDGVESVEEEVTAVLPPPDSPVQ
jgi:hypothetical protein